MGEKVSKGKILIVDDQSGIRESMSDVLLIEGYEVYAFESGFAAIEKAKEMSFDLAFLDIKMPGINGVETFRGIKKYSPETVVFMITANAEQELIDQAFSEGAYDVISKPFDMNLIIETVQRSQKKTAFLVVGEGESADKARQDLIQKGYKVIVVSDESKAKASFTRKAEDLVLVNVKGHLKTEEIFEKIRNITGEEDPQIIMINSCRVEGEIGEVITVGTKKLRGKDIDINELKKTVDDILNDKKLPDKASIMIVDNDTAFVNALSVELGNHGYNVAVVPNCMNAIKHLENSDFKLVLMNPELNVGECAISLEKIKSEKNDTEIVILPNSKAEGIPAAKYNYLYKPFDSAKILALVREICDKKRKTENA